MAGICLSAFGPPLQNHASWERSNHHLQATPWELHPGVRQGALLSDAHDFFVCIAHWLS